jgi:hypothetical protein
VSERAAAALVARLGGGSWEPPSPGSPREWVERLLAQLHGAAACALIEHLFAVLPLAAACFAPSAGDAPPAGEARPARAAVVDDLAAGRYLGALGFCTPTPEMGWEAAAVAGEPAGGGLRLSGTVRLAHPAAEGALLLVREAGGGHRLAWLAWPAGQESRDGVPPTSGTVVLQGSRSGGPVGGGAPRWLVLDGAAVGPEALSRPVALGRGGTLARCLDAGAAVWALAAARLARDGARALRRAARLHRHGGSPFSAAQQVAFGITAAEIEAELAVTAAEGHLAAEEAAGAAGQGLVLATAAARALAAVAARTAELHDRWGLPAEGPLAGAGAAVLTAFFGGAPMLEWELGRALGIADAAGAGAEEADA